MMDNQHLDVGPRDVLPRPVGEHVVLMELLRAGRRCTAYLGNDRRSGRQVIVKIVSKADLYHRDGQRLEHEAQVLRVLKQGGDSVVLDFGTSADDVYLIMPYIPGVTLAERLQQGPLGTADTVVLGLALAGALQSIHEQGILHRDIKPANIVLKMDAGPAGAVLIDFGLAWKMELGDDSRELSVGTALYVSPEQAGLISQGVDERSDLYSLGVVLYEALAGVVPFRGASVGEVLRQQVLALPPPIVQATALEATLTPAAKATARALDDVIRHLLAKDPRDRYQSAAALVHDLHEVRAMHEAAAAGHSVPPFVLGRQDRRHHLTEPAFIGRQAEVELLGSEWQQTRLGQAHVTFVEGPSGSGKSRLLTEMTWHLRKRGALVLRGQATDQSARRPFQELVPVAREFLQAAQIDARLLARLKECLGMHQAALTIALPEFRHVLDSGDSGDHGPEAFGEVRTMQALVRFLEALGTKERPAIVVLDDCQWSDELTQKLLVHWLNRLDAPPAAPAYVALILAFRSEEVPLSHLLRKLTPRQHLTLPPLSEAQIGSLVESMAGRLPTAAVQVVTRLADGSPFMASAVLRGMVEAGALTPQVGGWDVSELAMDDVQSSRRAALFLTKRMELLPEATLHLLTMAAVLGKAFSVKFAAVLSNQQPAEALKALAQARRRQIIWEDSAGDVANFVHDKLRETLLNRLSTADRQRLHLRAAEHLQAEKSGADFDIAYHFDAGGRSALALPFALAAAKEARSRHALLIAEQQYRIAERGLADVALHGETQLPDRSIALVVAQGLGEVLMLAGRYVDAQQQFEKARLLVQTDEQRAGIDTAIGELAFKRGDMRAAGQALERALRLLGFPVPQSSCGWLRKVCVQVARQALHTVAPRLFVGRCKTGPSPAQLQEMRIYSRLAYVYWFKAGKIACTWAHFKNLNMTERYPVGLELAQAYSEHGPVMTMIPHFQRGETYVRRSLQIRTEHNDPWGQGQSLHFLGVLLYASSRFTETIEVCSQAVRLLERTGDQWEVNTAKWHIAYAYYRLGDLPQAIKLAEAIHRDASRMGDHSSSGIALSIWAKAAGGALPTERIAKELNRNFDDVHTRTELLQAHGIALLQQGRVDEAVAALEQAHRLVTAAGFRQEYVAPVLPWLVTAMRQQIESMPIYAVAARRRRLRQALRLARRGRRLARAFANNMPQMLREHALLLLLAGKPRVALGLLNTSVAVATRQQARYELAQTLLVRSRYAQELGWGDGEADADAARGVLATTCAPGLTADLPGAAGKSGDVTLSLIDRFDTLLAAGCAITGATSAEAIFAQLQTAASQLFKGETCLVLLSTPGGAAGDFRIAAGDLHATFSVQVAKQATQSGKAVILGDERAVDPSDSMLMSDVRSVLCAPLAVRGRAIGCLYIAHARVGSLFSQEDEALCAFITSLTGAACENAEGFNQMRHLNASLEREVAEKKKATDELKEAKDAADAANSAKSNFLANMSHEIRTPLNAILGFSELLGDASLTEGEQQWFKDSIKRNGAQLLGVISDILDISKIEAGKLDVDKIPFFLSEELASLTSLMGRQAEAKGLRLILDIAPDVPSWTVSDPLRLRQILSNLVGNAIKFTLQGSVRLQVLAVGQAELLFIVTDTGIGMTPEQAGQIFQPFHQADATTSRRFGGTGLGLALSRQLARALGGDLVLSHSLPGAGSTFTLSIEATARQSSEALRSGEAAGLPERALTPVAAGPSARPLAAAHILLVEDGLDNQVLCRHILTRAGARTDVAGDGVEALAAVAAGGYDVILMDLQMPRMDGYEAIRELRARGCTIPILALTAHGMTHEKERCYRAGCSGYLTKPLNPAQLIKAIVAACNPERGLVAH